MYGLSYVASPETVLENEPTDQSGYGAGQSQSLVVLSDPVSLTMDQ